MKTMLKRQMTFISQRRATGQTVAFYRESGDRLYLPLMTGRVRGQNFQVDGKFDIEQYIIREGIPVAPEVEIPYKGSLRAYSGQDSIVDEALVCLDRSCAVMLNIRTGLGKTAMSICLCSKLNRVTLILVRTSVVAAQWVKAVERDLDLGADELAVVGGGKKVNIGEQTKLAICLVQSFSRLDSSFKDRVGTLIVDEVHTFINTTGAASMLGVCPDYVIGATATIPRPDGGHRMLNYFFGEEKVVRDLDIKFDVRRVDTHIVPERPLKRSVKNQRSELDFVAFQKKLMKCEERNKIIVEIVKMEERRPIIILTSMKNHVITMKEMLDKEGVKVDTLFSDKSSYKTCDVLIGTIPKVGIGFDEASCCSDYDGNSSSVLILATSIKDSSALIQAIGRVARVESPTIYHVVDQDPTMENHWRGNMSWYKAKKCPITVYDWDSAKELIKKR